MKGNQVTTRQVRNSEVFKSMIGSCGREKKALSKSLKAALNSSRTACPTTDLLGAFVWAESPQGSDFWVKLALQSDAHDAK